MLLVSMCELVCHHAAGYPSEVSLTASTPRTLIMTWEPPTYVPKKHGSFVAYTVECSSGGKATSTYKLKNVTEVTIDNFLPYKTYDCCVSFFTEQANSTEICEQQRTPEDGTVSYTQFSKIMLS